MGIVEWVGSVVDLIVAAFTGGEQMLEWFKTGVWHSRTLAVNSLPAKLCFLGLDHTRQKVHKPLGL